MEGNERWITEACEKVLGFPTDRNEEWMREGSWKERKEKTKIHEKVLSFQNCGRKEALKENYKEKEEEIIAM